ncbi:MAG: hypothetical protein Q9169_001264 [Polycauliona sp. 2 TL-2023]
MFIPLHFLGSLGAIAFLISIVQCLNIDHQIPILPVSEDGPTFHSHEAQAPAPRPFYLIAHRVLTSKGVDAALRNGANALEIDMMPYKEGWWADHDHGNNTRGDPARDIFNKIAAERRKGQHITFVWLDIKKPDRCDPNDQEMKDKCSVRLLRQLARDILQKADIRVMYGYIIMANSTSYPFIRDGLNSNEAINLDGNPKEALQRFESGGPKDKRQRVSSYGNTELPQNFGNCKEEQNNTCTELRQAVDSAKFGKVFGWVSTIGQGDYVRKELEIAGVDGMIYGLKNADYADVEGTRAAAKDLYDWVNDHPASKLSNYDSLFVTTPQLPYVISEPTYSSLETTPEAPRTWKLIQQIPGLSSSVPPRWKIGNISATATGLGHHIMFGDCPGPAWERDDFTTCFQRDYLQTLLPLVASILSFGYLALESTRRTVDAKRYHTYRPLKLIDEGDDQQPTLQPTTSRTNDSTVELDRPRGETFLVVLELLALVGEVAINLIALTFRSWGSHGSTAASAGIVSWCYILALSVLRLFHCNSRYSQIPKLWNHTALLYGINWLATILLFRSALVHPRSAQAQVLMVTNFVLVTLLALIALTSRKGNKAVVLEHEGGIEPSREPLASVLSLATFSWVDAIVWHGFKNTYELSAVWNLVAKDKAAAIVDDFRQLKKTSKLAWHLLKYFKRGLLIQASWAVIGGFFTFVPTMILKVFLEFVEDPEATPVNAAWFYIILLALSSCFEAVANGQALWIGRKICLRLRAVIIGEIYAKSLRRKAAAGTDTVLGTKKSTSDGGPPARRSVLRTITSVGRKKETTKSKPADVSTPVKSDSDSQVNVGTIINLMAVDSFKVGEVCAYLHFLWGSTPVQFVMCVVLLYRVLGYSSFVSIALMVAVMPLNLFIAKQFTRTQKKIMAATDARIHTTNEVLTNIRIIKYFAWEIRFGQIVNEKRRTELKALRNRYILWTSAATVWFGVPLLITFFSFMIYTLVEKKPLIPSVAFTALSLFSILRIPLDQLADMIAHVQECKVSVDRIEEFLNEDETEKYAQLTTHGRDEGGATVIGFDKAILTWGSKDAATSGAVKAFRMIDINTRFSIGELNLVVGPTGSGKTSLLMALLGEMTLFQGRVYLPGSHTSQELFEDQQTGLTESVAYCAQQAWLVNDTIKQNILFATPLDESRYKAVIAACALERDLQILDAGDQTLVGEKGIALSGGQKQRISLARALYCNARHILLDDCLSAVDSHTAKHIFEQCIRGPLMASRTCILVTHNIALCLPAARHVVCLRNGKISAQGSPDEVIASGVLGDDVVPSKPSSKAGTRPQSRVPSTEDLNGQTTKAHDGRHGKANSEMNGSAQPRHANDTKQEKNANSRTEAKAEGGVKKDVLMLYLKAMGSWYYWVFAVAVFIAQQFGSVLCNIWIRQWANSYQVRNAMAIATTNALPRNDYIMGASNSFSLSCLSGGTCSWNFPLRSTPVEVAITSAPDDEVDASYYLGVYALLAILYVLISMAREALIFWGSLVASWKLHERLLESVTRAKFRFFDSTPLGQIMNRFSKDVEAVDQEVAPIAVGVVGCLTSVITIVILISVITPGFLIAGVFITAVYFAIGAFYLRSSVDLKRLESVQKSPLYQQFGETLSGVTTIRAYGHEQRFIQDNLNRVDTYNRPFIYLWAANRWLALRVDVTGALVSFFAGVFIILRIKTIDAGAAGLSMTYAVMFSENILWLVRLYSVNEQNMNAVERLKEYMDVEQEAAAIKPEARPPGNWPSHGAIEFINYSTRYRSDLDPVLKNVTFRVGAGERVGIVGRTGAGKSSLALALFRGLEAEEGKIVIDEVDIGLVGLQDLRESITVVPQDPTLFTGTIRSNLDPFGLFTDEEIFSTLRKVQLVGAQAQRKSMVSETAEGLNDSSDDTLTLTKTFTNTRENANIFESLASPVAESGSNLSQGQRQLLCLARALLKAPKVLLMDEATASIDYATDSKIQDTLREVKDSTIITIAHRLQTIIDYDKVLVLDKGRVVEYDAPWELITQEDGIFQSMCEMSGELEMLTEEAKKAGSKKNRRSYDVLPPPPMNSSHLRQRLWRPASINATHGNGGPEQSSRHVPGPSLSTPSTCAFTSLNPIIQTLPQQCLTTIWAGNVGGYTLTGDRAEELDIRTVFSASNANPAASASFTAKVNAIPLTTTELIHQQPSESPHPKTSSDNLDPTTQEVIEASPEGESESPLDNAHFLSFEEWKKRNLAKAGQSPEHLGGAKADAAEPRRRPGAINNALDSLGEDTEIEIDFAGFVNPHVEVPGAPQPEQPASHGKGGPSDEHGNKEPAVRLSSAHPKSKDAGVTCKERSNYASFDCAATMLKTNSKCKSATSVLVENKDSYMLNECSAKNKFLIVELCNDILVDTVVLANYEFFSSIFRTFRVSVSDRYPVKLEKWRELGTFEASNSRGIQAFLVEQPQIWARYLRIEFLTHYGNEYYCPVSLLRVHGTTMMEEFNHELKNAKGEEDVEGEAEYEEVPQEAHSVHDVVSAEVLKHETVTPTRPSAGPSGAHPPPEQVTPGQTRPEETSEVVNAVESRCSFGDSPSAQLEAVFMSAAKQKQVCRRDEAPTENLAASSVAPNTDTTPIPKVTPDLGAILNADGAPLVPTSSVSVHEHTSAAMDSATGASGATSRADNNTSVSSKTSNQASQPSSRTYASSTQPSAPNPTTQESFFKSVYKRLQLLESNSTLSLGYIEDQSRILRDAFAKVEKRQLAKTTTFLETLNATVLNEVREFRTQYDQIWQSTVLELSSQRQQSQLEIAALSSRLTLLADELLFQKRIAILQFLLILLCLGLALFSRGGSAAAAGVTYLEHVVNKSSINLSRYASGFDSPSPGSPSSTRPPSRYGFFSRARSWDHRRSPSDDSVGGMPGHGKDATKSPSIEFEPATPTSLRSEEEDESPREEGSPGRGGLEGERDLGGVVNGVNGLLSPDERPGSSSSSSGTSRSNEGGSRSS